MSTFDVEGRTPDDTFDKEDGRTQEEMEAAAAAIPGMFESEVTMLGDTAGGGASGEATPAQRIFALFDDPESSLAAKLVATVIMTLILTGTVTFCAESLYCTDEFDTDCIAFSASGERADDVKMLDNLRQFEVFCILVFTVEYVARLLTCTEVPRVRYAIKIMNLIDLMAIMPFYVELLLGGHLELAFVRMLRMTRVFRVLKVGSFAHDLIIFVDGMSRASEALFLLSFLLLLYLCVFAALLYMVEYDAQLECAECAADGFDCSCPSVQGFTSIPTTWYFIIASMTTVGYGDMYPITIKGRLVCGLCMLCGIMVLALPMSIIGVAFEEAFEAAEQVKIAHALERGARRKAAEMSDMAKEEEEDERTAEQKQLDEIHDRIGGSADPEFSALYALKHAAQILFQQYMLTGDERFREARLALMNGLNEQLFLPEFPRRKSQKVQAPHPSSSPSPCPMFDV
eukprot:COSAG01_NODE_6151_length_3822_cov_9.606769_2_plen_457_part_00